jgi:hypothetical protein
MKMPRSLSAVTCLLLAVSCVALAGAWRTQATAASRLEEAKRVQDKPVPKVDGEAPTPALNRKILANLAQATEVRSSIDGSLRTVAASVERLRKQQGAAKDVANRTRRQLRNLAATLLSSLGPARGSADSLRRVVGELSVSASLARDIREELRKLDEKLGTPLP